MQGRRGILISVAAVFLDRDGVINPHPKFVNRPEDFDLYPWTASSIKRLNDAGLPVFVVTNQGGVGLGYMKEADLNQIHLKMERELAKEGAYVKEIAVCIHKPHDRCACRKPEAGMLLEIARKHQVDLSESFMVGDRDVDMSAGKRAGTKTVLIGDSPHPQADYRVDNLAEAVDLILKEVSTVKLNA